MPTIVTKPATRQIRKFGGKQYELADFTNSKHFANILARDFRSQGKLVRVTPSGKNWDIWVRGR